MLPLKGSIVVTIGVTIGVRHVCVDWSSSNYLAEANFKIEVTKVWAYRNSLAPAGALGRDQINESLLYCIYI